MAKKKPEKDKEPDYPGGYKTETVLLEEDKKKEKRVRHT